MKTSLIALLEQSWHQLEPDATLPTGWSVTRPEGWEFGDYTANIAMVAFAKCDGEFKNKWKSPRELAFQLCATLQAENADLKTQVAGPGFINFTLSNRQLAAEVTQAVNNATELIPPTQFSQKEVVVEFTDPNPFKEFHIGHLYSNIVGESVSRLLEKGGATVHRVCYQGDVGMHVAKSIWGLKTKLQNDGLSLNELSQKALPERVKYLGQAYALGATAYEESSESAIEIKDINYMVFIFGQENLVKTMNWQPQVNFKAKLSTEPTDLDYIRQLYTTGRQWSLAYFETIYQRLGTKFEDYFFESLVGELGLQLVKANQEKGIFKESQGAIIYPGSDKKLHDRVFINSQGLPTYEAKELGLAPEKYRRFTYDWSIIVTGNEIVDYFRVLIAALGDINPTLAQKTIHMSHGMVRLPEGKMSSRTGKIITGEWLLDEAKKSVESILTEAKQSGKFTVPTELEEQTAEQIGQAAIKFALLSSRLGKDIAFDFESSLSFSGFSGPYLQYTATRCRSLLEKGAEQGVSVGTNLPDCPDLTRTERLLLVELSRWPEVVGSTISELSPHILAEYLFALAQSFNSFYADQPILQSAKATNRLTYVSAVATILSDGLHLLGIVVPTKM